MENSTLLWNFPTYVSERICLRTGQGVEVPSQSSLAEDTLYSVQRAQVLPCWAKFSVSICVSVQVYVCIRVYVSVCVHMSVCMCVNAQIFVCVHVYIYIYVCMSLDIYTCVCAYVCIYVYIHICLCVYVCTGMYMCVCDGVPRDVSLSVVTIPSSRALRNN